MRVSRGLAALADTLSRLSVSIHVQDGSVKAVLTKSITSLRRAYPSCNSRVRAPHFVIPQPRAANMHLGPLKCPWRNQTVINYGQASFYRFLFNDFKSFKPLSKVLFIFPSQYLFAIGFPIIFSLGRSLSPYLNFSPKKLDSVEATIDSVLSPNTGLLPSLISRLRRNYAIELIFVTTRDYNSVFGEHRF